jgi:hypothetical protein
MALPGQSNGGSTAANVVSAHQGDLFRMPVSQSAEGFSFLDRVRPVVDKTIAKLAKTAFINDPIAGLQFSRATSIVSSAYKRHGKILEAALVESLRDSNRHRVWREDLFHVSHAADQVVGTQDEAACRATSLPYGEMVRTLQVDMIAWDDANHSLRAYEVKRGNGHFDAGKIRSIRRDLLCLQVLLKSYGTKLGLEPAITESKIIFYYGIRSISAPWSLAAEDLDEHFGFPVKDKIEQANRYFKERLHELLVNGA